MVLVGLFAQNAPNVDARDQVRHDLEDVHLLFLEPGIVIDGEMNQARDGQG